MIELQQCTQSYFGMNHEDMDKVVVLFQGQGLLKGEYFVKVGQFCKKLSFVQSGLTRAFAQTEVREVTQ